MSLKDWEIIAPLAYCGKEGCHDPRCRQRLGDPGCMGWHCSYCDEPCSSMGHGCDAAETLTAEAKRLKDES